VTDAVAAAEPLEPRPFVFEGDGREYFRIWIVNLALSVVTFGIYSAWAKVRRLQYFYRNTRLAGAGFDYHGSPTALLKGRIVAAIMLAVYYGAAAISPVAGIGAAVLLLLLLPWLLVRSLRFRCYNSSYRGIRFRFHGTTREAYWVYLGLPVLSIFTLFLLFPFAHHRMRRYQINNLAYGNVRFGTRVDVGEFYVAQILGAAALFAVIVSGVIALTVATAAILIARNGERPEDPPAIALVLFLAIYGAGLLLNRAIIQSRLQNAVWSHTRLGPHGFYCDLKIWRLFGILFSNAVLTIATIGLYLPFAQVQLMRYTAERFRFYPGGSVDEIASASADDTAALGEEAAELFDLDIAF
jgi:uncharacterized membrane protein YjgN (DUF898 family)